MDEMVKRVAKAMSVASFGDDGSWSEWTDEARAAIAAMREPNEAMLNAARDWSDAKYGKPIGNDAATGCWQAMLGATLRTCEMP